MEDKGGNRGSMGDGQRPPTLPSTGDSGKMEGEEGSFPSTGNRASLEGEDSGEGAEEGEIDEEEERPSLNTQEAVQEAANLLRSKQDEAKKKALVGVGHKIRPDLEEKFRPGDVQVLIERIVRDHLDGQIYEGEEMQKLSKVMSDEIQEKVKAEKYSRYKLITYVILGERRGEGVTAATRCIWDSDADCMATFTFLNETIFCCATVYGIFYY